MSELINHECGIALLRLLKPLEHYQAKYGAFYSLNKMHLMMQKQHNRGQDGAGIANLKIDVEPGIRYINRFRSNSATPIIDLFNHIYKQFSKIQSQHPELLNDPLWLKKNFEFTGELFLGHLRYGTFGGHKLENLHPVMRENNWMTKNLVLAGNFNMTMWMSFSDNLLNWDNIPSKPPIRLPFWKKLATSLTKKMSCIIKNIKRRGLLKRKLQIKLQLT